ncbi:hypothetical protein QJS10_CPB15g01963 [Acorus calamus]|uniref:Uncharacterized protein n=1 Tax=Acorus calamus TaxID=4465 RepID=A0AAV9D4G7_ACOCL|nr:hypothetical protein QJS10_CPB15g01963 [Acorus calamus]
MDPELGPFNVDILSILHDLYEFRITSDLRDLWPEVSILDKQTTRTRETPTDWDPQQGKPPAEG